MKYDVRILRKEESMKYNVEDVRNLFLRESVGYAILDYLDAKNIEDAKLSELWQVAHDSMVNVIDYVEKVTGKSIFDEDDDN